MQPRPEHSVGERSVVLIIDDESGPRQLLARYLHSNGFIVLEASDGVSGLEELAGQPVDVVLLDVVMPGMTGLQVLQQIRRSRTPSELPIILITSLDLTTDVVMGLQAGASDYITRPLNYPIVLARVRTQAELKASVDRIRRLERSLSQRNYDLEMANRQMEDDLQAASRVQRSLLPPSPMPLGGALFARCFQPCAGLAGDLLNVVPLDGEHVALYVLDVVGHGVRAALWAVMVNRELTRMLSTGSREARQPALMAEHLNNQFPFEEHTEQYFTLVYGVLRPYSGQFTFVCAGHPGPIHLPRGDTARQHHLPSYPVGLGDGAFDEGTIQMGQGDRLVLYSDGVTEAMNEQNQSLGTNQLIGLLTESRHGPLVDGLEAVRAGVMAWCCPQLPHDDISLLAAELI